MTRRTLEANIGGQGIDDDESGVGVGDHTLKQGEITGEGEGTTGDNAIRNGVERDDALRVATVGIDTRADGVMEVALGRDEEDTPATVEGV